MALRSRTFRNAEDYLHIYQSNMTRIKSLAGEISTQGQEPIQVRAVPYVPSFGLMLFEYSNQDPKIYVQLVPFKNKFLKGPGFVVNKESDPYWYDFFFSQYASYWSASKPIEVPKQ
jgi:hypothetical protein